jgi:hypothetical protein
MLNTIKSDITMNSIMRQSRRWVLFFATIPFLKRARRQRAETG